MSQCELMVETGFEHIWFHFSSNSDSNLGPSLMLKIAQLQAPYSLFLPQRESPWGRWLREVHSDLQGMRAVNGNAWESLRQTWHQGSLCGGRGSSFESWRTEAKTAALSWDKLSDFYFVWCVFHLFPPLLFFFPNLFLFSGLRTQSLK